MFVILLKLNMYWVGCGQLQGWDPHLPGAGGWANPWRTLCRASELW